MDLTTTTTVLADEPVTLTEAKTQLGILHHESDTEVNRFLTAAREFCEQFVGRTLRVTVSRVATAEQWAASRVYFDFPPLISVTSVKYYDTNNAQQTLAATNYDVVTTTQGRGYLQWSHNSTLPSLYDRPNAIEYTWSSGYAARSDVPEAAKAAIKLVLQSIYDPDGMEALAVKPATMRRAMDLLNSVQYGSYG